MFDDEEEDNGFFLLVLGVLAAILLVVTVVAQGGGDLPTATVTGDTVAETPETTEAPTTTTEAPATTEAAAEETTTTTEAPPEPVTLWDALVASGAANQFAALGGPLGLEDTLSAMTDADGNPVEVTVFAPSDSALAALDAAVLGGLLEDQDAANALVGYHFVPGTYTAADLAALDGETLTTLTGLPLAITVIDGEVVLGGTSRVSQADIGADNGVAHSIDLLLTPPTVNEVLGLENIEFEVSSANITAAGQAELDIASAFFAENPDLRALIEGHTDTDGSAEGNQALSQARAEAVKTYLEGQGIAADRLDAIGLGETSPILDADGVEDKAASRRIEFEVR